MEDYKPDRSFLIAFIRQMVDVPYGAASEIAAGFAPITYAKADVIIQPGKICDCYTVIENGFARAFTFDAVGNETTTNFYTPGSIVFEVASFFKRVASRETVQAHTSIDGWKLNYEQLNSLFHAMPAFREFGRAVLVNGFTNLKERMLSMITDTAEQRYEHLLRTQPDILQYIPLKYIASYLGITDTSLSRIRKEFTRN